MSAIVISGLTTKLCYITSNVLRNVPVTFLFAPGVYHFYLIQANKISFVETGKNVEYSIWCARNVTSYTTYVMINMSDIFLSVAQIVYQGPIVQSIVSLTTLLRGHLVKYIPTTLSNTLLYFCWKNVRIFCIAKDSHIFQTKNNSVFVILMF